MLCILVALREAFETVILPRTVKRGFRLTSVFFALSGKTYAAYGRIRSGSLRMGLLNSFAPFTLLVLIAMWAVLLVLGFALIHWGLKTPFSDVGTDGSFIRHIYFSGVTFFTLGYGDAVPHSDLGRGLAVLEAGLGFGFLAVIIAYVPVLYGAFSRREVGIIMLDTRAGSSPTGFELLRRHADGRVLHRLVDVLKDWERFSAELLESYLSYPLIAYYRSQHDDQSWLKSLVSVMDACALIEVGVLDHAEDRDDLRFQARATLAMARHVLVDLAYILDIPPHDNPDCRMTVDEASEMQRRLKLAGLDLCRKPESILRMDEVRRLYEPYAIGLSEELILDLPDWLPPVDQLDHWQTSAWESAKHF